MKLKNIFLALTCLSTIALGGCKSQNVKSSSDAHEHLADAYGFCSCGAYLGETLEFTDDVVTKTYPEMEDNGAYFFRVVSSEGYGYDIINLDEIEEEEVFGFTMYGGSPTNMTFDKTRTPLGEDGYIYLAIHTKSAHTNALISIERREK